MKERAAEIAEHTAILAKGEIVITMLEPNLTFEEISQLTELSIGEIKALKNEC